MVERRKTKAMAAKRQRVRKRIRLFSKEKENYKSNTGNETDLGQSNNDKNPLQL